MYTYKIGDLIVEVNRPLLTTKPDSIVTNSSGPMPFDAPIGKLTELKPQDLRLIKVYSRIRNIPPSKMTLRIFKSQPQKLDIEKYDLWIESNSYLVTTDIIFNNKIR
jgi:hypothetical protein